jgi:hypothetical protein
MATSPSSLRLLAAQHHKVEPAGGEPAANALQPGSSNGSTTTANANVIATVAALPLVT